MITSSDRRSCRFNFAIPEKSAPIATVFSRSLLAVIASLMLALSACGGGGGGGGSDSPATVDVAPTILTQPQTADVDVGEPATFAVVAEGSGTLTYQWSRNGEVIAGANQSTYRIAAALESDSGASFTVRVRNSKGAAVSNTALLQVYANAPVITVNPPDQTITGGNSVTLNVVAHGAPPLKFQWRKYGVAIPGAISAAYTTPPLSPSDSGANFDVIVTNDFGSASSNPFIVTVAAVSGQVSIVTQPQALSVNEGDIATFLITAGGTGPFEYQWRRNGVAIRGAYESTYRFTAAHLHNGDQYSVDVSNAMGAVSSTPINLTVSPAAISLLLGTLGQNGNLDGVADQARFSCPTGIVGDAAGNLYVVSGYSGAVRKINPNQAVSTFVGNPLFVGSTDGTGSNARFRSPSGIAIDLSGNLYVTDGGNSTIRKITPGGVVTTIAGTVGNRGSADGTGAAAQFNLEPPDESCSYAGIAVDILNNLYVADTANHTIRKISSAGVVTTLAGSAGQAGLADGNGVSARFNHPEGVAVDNHGNIFVADSFNGKIRKIDASGNVTTLSKTFGTSNPSGPPETIEGIAIDSNGLIYASEGPGYIWRSDTAGNFNLIAGGYWNTAGIQDGIGTNSKFDNPRGLYVDAIGNLFVTQDHSIRKIRADYRVSTWAGKDYNSIFTSLDGVIKPEAISFISDIAVDSAGNIYKSEGNAILKITPTRAVSIFAGSLSESGTNDGVGTDARFMRTSHLVIDSASNLYVSDSGAHTIRKITAGGIVTTFAGSPNQAGAIDGQGTAARFNSPWGVAVDAMRNLYVADLGNQTIRKISTTGVVTTLAGTVGVQGWTNGNGSSATFSYPRRLTADGFGNVFVLEDSPYPIRKIAADGSVTAVGSKGSPGVDGSNINATFSDPQTLASDGRNVYISDRGRIRKLASDGSVTTIVGSADSQGVLLGALSGSLYWPYAMISVPSVSGTKLLVVDEGALLSITLP